MFESNALVKKISRVKKIVKHILNKKNFLSKQANYNNLTYCLKKEIFQKKLSVLSSAMSCKKYKVKFNKHRRTKKKSNKNLSLN